MNILRTASAGTLESSDCRVTVSPAEKNGLEYTGANSAIFAKRTQALVESVLAGCGAENVMVTIHDMGAIEITIRARLETALERASAEEA